MSAVFAVATSLLRPLLWPPPSGEWPAVEQLAAAVRGGAVLHGSRHLLERIDTRRQTNYQGVPVDGIFATRDPIWPIFYATLDRDSAGTLRCQCVPGRRGTRYGFSTSNEPHWGPGWIHLLPAGDFEPIRGTCELVRTSTATIEPFDAVPVGPSDFPFLACVGRHDTDEPIWRTWWNQRRGPRQQ